MRSVLLMTATALLLCTTSSCDTTQPLQADSQLIELFVDTSGYASNNVRFFNVYDGMSDCNADGQPDDDDMDGEPDVFLHCLTRTSGIPTGGANGFPWNYTVEVTVVPTDAPGPERVTSLEAREDPSFSLTPSDTRTNFQVAPPPALNPINLGGCRFTFSNRRVLTAINNQVLAATENPLADLAPLQYGVKGQGLCSTQDPGPPVVDRLTGTDYPYAISLGKGESLTIKIVSGTSPPEGVQPADYSGPGPSIRGRLLLNGSDLGVTGAVAGPGEDFSISYTSR